MPIYSLDGGRIVTCIFTRKFNRKIGVKITKIIGVCFSLLLFFAFIITCFFSINFSIGCMSIFLFVSCAFSGNSFYNKITAKSKKEKLKNRLELEVKTFMFSNSVKLIDLYRKIKFNSFSHFCIVGSKNRVYNLDEDQLFLLLEKFGAGVKIYECGMV